MSVGRLLSFIAWDGFLPVAAVLSPWVLGLLIGGEGAAVLSVAIAPPVFAFVRCSIAYRQLQTIGGGRASAWRQLVMGLALVSLMLFEALFNGLQAADERPVGMMIATGLFFVVYLSLVWLALWQPRGAGPETFDADVDYTHAGLETM